MENLGFWPDLKTPTKIGWLNKNGEYYYHHHHHWLKLQKNNNADVQNLRLQLAVGNR